MIKGKKKYDCFAEVHPDLVCEWHPSKNGEITPWDVCACSGKYAWWLCRKCSNEWQAKISYRHNGSGCRVCGKVVRSNNHKVNENNCLAVIHPELAMEWHPTKNGDFTPYKSTACGGIKVWWQCAFGHEWQATPNSRTSGNSKIRKETGKTGCPYCSGRRTDKKSSLAVLMPELALEWHQTKNNLTPYDVRLYANRHAWWRCSKCGHEWETLISNRTRGSRCPRCKRSRGEEQVESVLNKYNLDFEIQAKMKGCKDKRTLRFDFAVIHNGKKHLIEYQGRQHYLPIRFGGYDPDVALKRNQELDNIKRTFCQSNSIPLLEISYLEDRDMENKITTFLDIKGKQWK